MRCSLSWLRPGLTPLGTCTPAVLPRYVVAAAVCLPATFVVVVQAGAPFLLTWNIVLLLVAVVAANGQRRMFAQAMNAGRRELAQEMVTAWEREGEAGPARYLLVELADQVSAADRAPFMVRQSPYN